MVDASTVRIVPPPDPSKMQKKKRRSNKPKTAESPVEGSIVLPDATFADVVEQTPEQANEASVASERVAPLVAPTFGDPILKSGPVAEILQKRLKALNKKISRITRYASTDYKKLNDDQKRALKSLPLLQKELEDVKELVESPEELDLVLQKRLKALNKKISRITSYASTDYTKLNNDQRRALSTLPLLKKELEDVKKLSHEVDLARELAARGADADAAESKATEAKATEAKVAEAKAAEAEAVEAEAAEVEAELLLLLRHHHPFRVKPRFSVQ